MLGVKQPKKFLDKVVLGVSQQQFSGNEFHQTTLAPPVTKSYQNLQPIAPISPSACSP